eukprot:TRINITY_DN18871_c0_g1_i1.p1 TRINITY_DN18871_c0_g1~~TRINITY_DN18871_c0_g1_i1.p1  ORF type:complete len:430 (-),score=107.71 TRINITY_DN18871_c0_g1_i1:154-1443(-)
MLRCALIAVLIASTSATNKGGFPNDLGTRPPMGWRSWNAFYSTTTQAMLTAQINALVMRRHSIDGVPTSLQDLGYNRIGMDDGWQLCGAGVNGSFHNASGWAIIDTAKFPDITAMTTYAHSLNVSMDWYLDNDGCAEGDKVPPYYANDAALTAMLGWDGAKFDGGGPGYNMTAWAVAFNATGRPLLMENCNDADPFRPTATDCPYNFFRTSIDNSPNFISAVSNLLDTEPYLSLSRPGCFAYPDMLEMGAPAAQFNTACDPTRMSFTESQGSFGAWCVLSSPLVLGFDLSNMTEYDTWWPLVSNRDAIAINQAWAGEAGHLVAQSQDSYGPLPVFHGAACEVSFNRTMPYWTVWGKALPDGSFAAIALNSADTPQDIVITTEQLGFASGATLNSRDAWSGQAVPPITAAWKIPSLPSHGNLFYVFSAAS